MSVARGDVWWADLGEPRGSEPAFRRPVVVVQSDRFNATTIATVVVVVVTTNLNRAGDVGNVRLHRGATGLREESVANVTQVATVDRVALIKRVGRVPADALEEIDAGLKLVLDLD